MKKVYYLISFFILVPFFLLLLFRVVIFRTSQLGFFGGYGTVSKPHGLLLLGGLLMMSICMLFLIQGGFMILVF